MKHKLEDFETYIKNKARFMADGPWDYEDFEQEGRIAAWRALEFDPSATKSLVHMRIDWRMLDYARKIYPNLEVGYTSAQENMLYGGGQFENED